MMHAEYLVGNPLTGRKVWLIRHIKGTQFGDPWDWSVVVVKSHHFSQIALVKGAININNYKAHKLLQDFLAGMGFSHAETFRRNGVLKRYRLAVDNSSIKNGGFSLLASSPRSSNHRRQFGGVAS